MKFETQLPPIGSECIIDLPYGSRNLNLGDDFPNDGWVVNVVAHVHDVSMIGTRFEWMVVFTFRAGDVGALRVDMCGAEFLTVIPKPNQQN